MLKNTKFWSGIFVFWLIALLVLSIIPNFSPESIKIENKGFLRTDYIQHFLVFLVLPIFYFFSGQRTFLNRFLKSHGSLIFAGIIYASFTELIQLLVPGRTFNPVDLLLNVSGLITGVLLGWLGWKYKNSLLFGFISD